MIKYFRWLKHAGDGLIFLLGAAAVSYGCWRVYPPAGWIAGGLALIVFALLL